MKINLHQIVEGWRNRLFPPEELKQKIQQVSDLRMETCAACEFNSTNAKPKGYQTLRPDEFCTACGCNLEAKTKCFSCSCPLDKWKAIATDQEWDQIKKQASES